MIPAVLAICALMFVLTVNFVVVGSVKGDVDENFPDGTEACAVVLGAKVHEGGRLSDMLRDRMDTAISLYESGKVGKLLLSGDGRGEWGEVKYMKLYAMEKGVPEEDILLDPEGYSTYETMQRARDVYGLEYIVAVTQRYHLYRAMYIARDLGMETRGASADLDIYAGQLYRDLREVLARIKDFGICVFN
jgi:vancomycin permeability regulator SanA